MKISFNQFGCFRAVVGNTAWVFLWVFLMVGLGGLQNVCAGVVVKLAAGVTGVEIQQALDICRPAAARWCCRREPSRSAQPIVVGRDFQTLRGLAGDRFASRGQCELSGDHSRGTGQRSIPKPSGTCVWPDFFRWQSRPSAARPAARQGAIRNNGITVQAVSDSVGKMPERAPAHRSGGLVTTLGVARLTVRNLTAFDTSLTAWPAT